MYNRDPLEYYQVLEVSPDADARTIKLSYRDRAKEWHPDYNLSLIHISEPTRPY